MSRTRDRIAGATLAILTGLTAPSPGRAATIDGLSMGAPADAPLAAASSRSRERAMRCLTQAIYYEAGSEPVAGQQAVAQVVLNRLRRPAFPKSVCGVVFEGAWRATGCQFTFTCDGSLYRPPAPDKWARAQSVAAQALGGFVDEQVGDSTHYHASWMTPYWSASLVETTRIGGHVFYRMAGATPPAMLSATYSDIEPDPASLSPAISAGAIAPPPRSARRRGHAVAPPPPSQPSTFSVWGLGIATVTPRGQALMVRPQQSVPPS
jgi:hypothetical protein